MDDVYVGDVPGIVVSFTNLRYSMMRELLDDDKVVVVGAAGVGAVSEGIFFIFVGRGGDISSGRSIFCCAHLISAKTKAI